MNALIKKHTALFLFAFTPTFILEQADQIRNPAESFLMKVEVSSGEKGEDRSLFEVAIQGSNLGKMKTLIKTLAPARDLGRNLLMLDENMWAFVPNLNRAVRVSLNQKLTGQAANGDLSRMRWTGDYTPIIEKETPTEWILFLTANKKGLTYEKLRVWIEKKTYMPKKAELLTLDSKILKNVTYEDLRQLAGRLRPGVMRIQDALRVSEVSLIRVKDMVVKQFPASLMNQNSLK